MMLTAPVKMLCHPRRMDRMASRKLWYAFTQTWLVVLLIGWACGIGGPHVHKTLLLLSTLFYMQKYTQWSDFLGNLGK